ncbi:MAG: FeoB-associated Cys-rich membrane protein [Pyrinomonadaceae bacterium]
MRDWQTIFVALIILGAAIYVARRAWSRLRGFTKAGANSSSCETGCGKCGSASDSNTAPANSLVQIGRSMGLKR